MSLTTSQFRDFVVSQTANRMSDITESEFVAYLNQALINRYDEMVRLVPQHYSKKTSITASGYTASLPSDFKKDQTLELYDSENYEGWEALVPDDYAYLEAGVIRFGGNVSDTYYLRYVKDESEYVSGDSVLETDDKQAKQILAEEIKALYYEAFNEGRATDNSVNALNKATRIS